MVFYALSAAGVFFPALRIRRLFWTAGCIASAAAWLFHWFRAFGFPLQTMFEIFLTLGMLQGPLSWFCRRWLGMRDPLSEFAEGLLGFCILFPAGFVFPEHPRPLPPALQSPLFIPHVGTYMFAYILLAHAAVQAAGGLFAAPVQREYRACRLVRLAFPFLTMGLILGSIWAKIAWGDWWSWDPKELWSLTCWLIYLAYFHWRADFGVRYVKANLWMLLVGFLAVLCTLLLVNLSTLFKGLHNYAG
ncbi:MAG TPA: cytochrome c biogenesis protein CcsA [Anaerohalosphaeraceae bacterium]|nr:cytochrome c biogenesis protein CcsA [Anaerohalosphaeraceae bacterium]